MFNPNLQHYLGKQTHYFFRITLTCGRCGSFYLICAICGFALFHIFQVVILHFTLMFSQFPINFSHKCHPKQ